MSRPLPVPPGASMRFRSLRSTLFVAVSTLFAAGFAPLPRAQELVMSVDALRADHIAQESDVQRVIALGQSDSRVMEHLDHLTNRIGPRLTGSHGFHDACEWAVAQFESFGLTNCHLEKWGEFPVGFNRGPSFGRMIAPEKKDLHFGTNAWTAGTHGPTSAVVVLAPTNDDELAAVRPKLKGAWVLVPAAPAPTGNRGQRNAPGGTPPIEARADGVPAGGAPANGATANGATAADTRTAEARPADARPN